MTEQAKQFIAAVSLLLTIVGVVSAHRTFASIRDQKSQHREEALRLIDSLDSMIESTGEHLRSNKEIVREAEILHLEGEVFAEKQGEAMQAALLRQERVVENCKRYFKAIEVELEQCEYELQQITFVIEEVRSAIIELKRLPEAEKDKLVDRHREANRMRDELMSREMELLAAMKKAESLYDDTLALITKTKNAICLAEDLASFRMRAAETSRQNLIALEADEQELQDIRNALREDYLLLGTNKVQ